MAFSISTWEARLLEAVLRLAVVDVHNIRHRCKNSPRADCELNTYALGRDHHAPAGARILPEYRAALGVRIHNVDHIEAVHCRKVGVFNDGLIIAADEVRQADTLRR